MNDGLHSAHIGLMSKPKRTSFIVATMALTLVSVTGCSAANSVVTEEDREAFEATRFPTPEGQSAADGEQTRASSNTAQPGSVVPDLNDVLLHPEEWRAVARGKLCEYTTSLMSNAARDGTAVPESTQRAAEGILERC